MTIKQKFSSIDQSKLTADQKAFLDKIKDVTKNFTDKEMNKKVEAPLDGFIAKAKEKMPEAIKSAPAKRTTKSKAKPSQTRKPKRTAMSLAKEIRKEGESWNDARARASKMMKDDSKDLSKTVETELEKLTKMVRSQKSKAKLVGISKTDIGRDASRKAKPRGVRKVTKSGETSNQYGTYKNHLGRKYYESRDRHSDRLAPNYPKNAPYLAEGGYLTDPNFGNFQNTIFNKGGAVTNERLHVNHDEDYEVRYAKPRPHRKGYKGVRAFELGGNVVTDLAGHTGGSLGTGDPSMLDGVSGTAYTGLVGETGAMSSGEMFMAGGKIGEGKILVKYDVKDPIGYSNSMLYYYFDLDGNFVRSAGDFGKPIPQVNISEKEFKKHYKENIIDKSYKVEFKNGTSVPFIETLAEAKEISVAYSKYGFEAGGTLPSGASQSYMITESLGNPAQHFATGGGVRKVGNREYSYGRNWTNDHRHINQDEEHEITYNRKGKFLGIFDGGGETYNEKASQLKGGVDYYSVDIDLDNGDEIRDLTFKSLDKAKKEFLKYSNSMVYDGENIDDIQLVVSFKNGDYENIYLNKGGAVTNERRYVNKGEDYEVRYSKPILRRKGYQGKRDFAIGGAIKNQYAGRTPEDIWNNLSVEQRQHFLIDHFIEEEDEPQVKYKYLYDEDKEFIDEYSNKEWKKLSGDVRGAFREHVKIGEYNKGGALTNERLHVNHDEDYEVRYSKPRPKRKGYKGARKFMAGGSMETPKIYVADLEAYNNGRLSGVWLDLADYNNADELMDAIQDFLKTSGGEEYAIHDVEYVPRSLYSEYMSKNDFEALYEVMETAKRYDLPLEVVEEIVSQYGEGGVDEFYGKYDDAEDFAMQLVDDIGIESFIDYEYYMYVTDTDRRLISQEQADFYVENIADEDGGNRIIEEADLDVEEYEEADSEMQEEMLDKAKEIVYDRVYDQWYEGLDDPKYFLVDEQGIYDTESFANANFVRVDYEKLGDALEQDYTFIEHDGDLYVFNIR